MDIENSKWILFHQFRAQNTHEPGQADQIHLGRFQLAGQQAAVGVPSQTLGRDANGGVVTFSCQFQTRGRRPVGEHE